MNWHKIQKVLVTSARTPSATDMILRLQKAGFEVHAADSIYWPMGRWLGEGYLRYASPTQSIAQFEQDLLDYIQAHEIQLVLPNAEETFYLSMIKDRLQCPVFVGEISILHSLHHKRRVGELLSSIGLKDSLNFKIPENIDLKQWDDTRDLHHFVMKKNYSRFGEETYIEVSQDLLQAKQSHPEADEFFLQEKISGVEISTYAWYENGVLLHSVHYLSKLRVSKAAIHFELYEYPHLDEILTQVGFKLNLTGQISFDFMKVQEEIWLIECNPRGTSGIHLMKQFPFEHQTLELSKNQLLGPPLALSLMARPQQLISSAFWKLIIEAQFVFLRRMTLGSLWIWLPGFLEFLFHSLWNRKTLTRVMCEDLEYNGGHNAHPDRC